MEGQTDGQTDGRTDISVNGQIDTPSYNNARAHLQLRLEKIEVWVNSPLKLRKIGKNVKNRQKDPEE